MVLCSCGRGADEAPQQSSLVRKKRKPESGALHHRPFTLRHLLKGLGQCEEGKEAKTHVIDGLLVTWFPET